MACPAVASSVLVLDRLRRSRLCRISATVILVPPLPMDTSCRLSNAGLQQSSATQGTHYHLLVLFQLVASSFLYSLAAALPRSYAAQ